MPKETEKLTECPICGAKWGFNEIQFQECDSCGTPDFEDEDEYDYEEDNFNSCDSCDLPDACADFGCAVKAGLKKPETPGIF